MSLEPWPGMMPAAFSVLFMLDPYSHPQCFFVYNVYVSSSAKHQGCYAERLLNMILGRFFPLRSLTIYCSLTAAILFIALHYYATKTAAFPHMAASAV